MPGKKWRINPSLIQRLRDTPYRFEFFQAVRVLLASYRENFGEQDLDVLGQVIRFRNSTSLAFPPSEIEMLDFEWDDGEADASGIDRTFDGAPRMVFKGVTLTPSFIGLTGPSGVLPRHYTQHVAERETYHRDTAARAFLDIFTSRAVALFYQAWLKYRLHLQYEVDRKNHFLPLVLSLAGLGLPGMHQRLNGDFKGIADESLAYYASALRERPQSVQWFSRVVGDYFNIRCTVEQFVGQWFQLPDSERTCLGAANCALGVSSFCGARVWDRQTKVRLIIGPLRKEKFDEFLPNGAAARKLRHLFRLMVGASFDCEVRLVLDKRDVTSASLGTSSASSQLGWTGWVKSRDVTSDSHDAAYLIAAGDPI